MTTEEARRLFASGDVDKALAAFRERAQRHPDDAGAQHNLGLMLAKQGDFAGAAAQLRRAVELDADYFEARRDLAMALRLQGQVDAAIPQYAAALDLRPTDATVHNELGRLLAMRGDAPRAMTHLREAIRLQPGRAPFLMDLAWLLATHDDPTIRSGGDAVMLAEQACAATQYQDPRALDVLAAAYAEAGRFREAREIAQRGLTLAQAAQNQQWAQVFAQRSSLYQANQPLRATSASMGP